MDLSDFSCFFDHSFCISCCSFYFSTDRSIYNSCDLFDNIIELSS